MDNNLYINPTEHIEAAKLASWLEVQKQLGKVLEYSKVSQETYTSSWNQKRKNRVEGVKKGVPDYIIITPKMLLFCELKRQQGGKVSDDQEVWIKTLNEGNYGKVRAFVARGAEEAQGVVERYI